MDFQFMLDILPEMLRAAVVTVEISALALVFGTALGIAMGSARVLGPRWLKAIIQAIVDFIRGVPPLVPIAFIYFALPRFNIVLSEFWTGVVALSLIAAGYIVEIVRASLESIDKGQTEAAMSIGMTDTMALRFILLPQAATRMIPPLTNELANVVKASSLLSIVAVREITHVGNALIFENFVFLEVILQMALLYLIVTSVVQLIARAAEKRFAYVYGADQMVSEIR
jgi:polar amino acid transport system permease protein